MRRLVVPALRASPQLLVQNVARRRKKPTVATATAGVSNGGVAYGHGGFWALVVLLHLCQQVLLELRKFIGRQCAALAQGKQGL